MPLATQDQVSATVSHSLVQLLSSPQIITSNIFLILICQFQRLYTTTCISMLSVHYTIVFSICNCTKAHPASSPHHIVKGAITGKNGFKKGSLSCRFGFHTSRNGLCKTDDLLDGGWITTTITTTSTARAQRLLSEACRKASIEQSSSVSLSHVPFSPYHQIFLRFRSFGSYT